MSIIRNIKETWSFAGKGGACGWLLLLRPVLYFLFSRRRDTSEYSSIDTSALIFIIFAFASFLFATHVLYTNRGYLGRMMMHKTSMYWFLAYIVFSFITMIWSVSASLTGFRAFECLSMVLLIVSVVQNLLKTGGYELTMKWVTLYVVTEIIFSLVKASQYTLNLTILLESSQMLSTVFFYMAFYAEQKRWWHWLIMTMAIFSGSTVAYLGMAIGIISIFWTSARYRGAVVVVTYVLTVVVVSIGPEKVLKDTVFYDKNEISLRETSGRDKIMEVAIKSLEENSWGYGFFAGEPYVLYRKFTGAINGHNSFFSAAMGCGWPGVILMAIFFLMMTRDVFGKHIPPNYKPTIIGCWCVAFVQCMGNPGLGSRVYGAWMAEMMVVAIVCGFYVAHKYYRLR